MYRSERVQLIVGDDGGVDVMASADWRQSNTAIPLHTTTTTTTTNSYQQQQQQQQRRVSSGSMPERSRRDKNPDLATTNGSIIVTTSNGYQQLPKQQQRQHEEEEEAVSVKIAGQRPRQDENTDLSTFTHSPVQIAGQRLQQDKNVVREASTESNMELEKSWIRTTTPAGEVTGSSGVMEPPITPRSRDVMEVDAIAAPGGGKTEFRYEEEGLWSSQVELEKFRNGITAPAGDITGLIGITKPRMEEDRMTTPRREESQPPEVRQGLMGNEMEMEKSWSGRTAPARKIPASLVVVEPRMETDGMTTLQPGRTAFPEAYEERRTIQVELEKSRSGRTAAAGETAGRSGSTMTSRSRDPTEEDRVTTPGRGETASLERDGGLTTSKMELEKWWSGRAGATERGQSNRARQMTTEDPAWRHAVSANEGRQSVVLSFADGWRGSRVVSVLDSGAVGQPTAGFMTHVTTRVIGMFLRLEWG